MRAFYIGKVSPSALQQDFQMSCSKSPPVEQAEADSSGVGQWQESSSLFRCGVSASAQLSPESRLQATGGGTARGSRRLCFVSQQLCCVRRLPQREAESEPGKSVCCQTRGVDSYLTALCVQQATRLSNKTEFRQEKKNIPPANIATRLLAS